MNTSFTTSETEQNYLKAIYHLSSDTIGASAQDIATHLGVSAPGVTKMLRHLSNRKFIEYTKYHPAHLTTAGEKIALEVIRHHRLLELYLVKSLGFGWDRVHAEAERLEHHISEELEETIERLLGYPTHDPHGDPIPTKDGKLPLYTKVSLDDQLIGSKVIVKRVVDEDEVLLRYLDDRGLQIGTKLTIIDREPFGGSLVVEIDARIERISPGAAQNIFIENAMMEENANA